MRFLDTLLFLLRVRRYDIVILQVYSGLSLILETAVSVLVRGFGKRMIMTVHGGGVPDAAKRWPFLFRLLFSYADVVTSPSNYIRTSLSQYCPDIVVVPNMIDIAELPFRSEAPEEPVVLWMRSFSKVYNPFMAVRVFKRIHQRNKGVRFVMAGSDLGCYEEVKRYAYQMGLEGCVVFPGYLSMEMKKYYGSLASVYISTNRIDNAPVSLLEMSAMGVPIVATRVGGVPFLYTDGVSIRLVNEDDDAAMEEQVLDLMSRTPRAARMIHAAHELSREHAIEKVIVQWESLLLRQGDSSRG